MTDQINYYEVLGVPRNASRSEIKNAYRRLAKDRHPDRPGGSEVDFSRLQEAHAVLSDPNRRRRHDEALDLAHAADQLAGVIDVDWSKLEDELSQKRRERESRGGGGDGRPGLGERLRNRFRREEALDGPGGRESSSGRGRSRPPAPQARWYEPHEFEPEPVTWKTGALSFVGAFLAFIAVGQIGRWAVGMDEPPVFAAWALVLAPFMWILYSLAGFLGAYFSYRAAGWAGVALVFVAALVVGGSGGPPGLVQFTTLGIVVLVAAIYLGRRRARANWRDRRR
jgi:molecular chaperone DnaJ